MGIIRTLDKATVEKIAAGEVVERPASAIKELLENAMDAGADIIEIEIRDGGRQYMRVTDNGKGMSPEDARICWHSHTTSKLESLDRITTLGFRGEALSSVCAVSRTTISTCDGKSGTVLEIDGGVLSSESTAGLAQGTSIEVRDLFYNTPARKNYLRSREVEQAHIADIVTRYSLSDSNISLRLVADGREIFSNPKSKNYIDRIACAYSGEIAKNMVAVEYSDNFAKVSGFIGKPYISRADRGMQAVFINKRHVRCDAVTDAIYQAYKTLLFLERNPVAVLRIEMDFSGLDVNVHPAKDIVKIEKEYLLRASVFAALKKTFSENSLIPELEPKQESNAAPRQSYGLPSGTQAVLYDADASSSSGMVELAEKPAAPAAAAGSRIGKMRALGQANRTYIIAQGESGIFIADQHACEERVNFEKFMRQKTGGRIERMRLLEPLAVTLPRAEIDAVLSKSAELDALGFSITEHGKSEILVREAPLVFGAPDREFVRAIANEAKNAPAGIETAFSEKIAMMACKSSIKAGDELPLMRLQKLLDELCNCEKPYSCPHGRPTIISFGYGDLEKKFKRTP
jgi:DNA mismatch repair protein MutL